jgi:nucleoside-diphosphate-sugar epimerase
MRVLVLGGTRFIGARIVAELVERGDQVMVVHRGVTEPDDLPGCEHLHTARAEFHRHAGAARDFAADAVVDTSAMTRADADAVLPHLGDCPVIVLSSMDVYRAFGLVLANREGEAVPLDEQSSLREQRYPYRGTGTRPDDYDKLDVEPSYLERGGTVLRLAMIYGERDPQRREEFILRRVRAGRTRIPIGPGTWLWTRCYVGDVARAVLASINQPAARGEVLDIGEAGTRSIRGWAEQILATAARDADASAVPELVTVPEAVLPEDMWITRSVAQHLVFRSVKATQLLDWQPADPAPSIARSVRWHLDHPPADPSEDFSDDDRALAAA